MKDIEVKERNGRKSGPDREMRENRDLKRFSGIYQSLDQKVKIYEEPLCKFWFYRKLLIVLN